MMIEMELMKGKAKNADSFSDDSEHSLLTSIREVVVSGAHVGKFPWAGELEKKTLKAGFSVIQKRIQLLFGLFCRLEIGEEPVEE